MTVSNNSLQGILMNAVGNHSEGQPLLSPVDSGSEQLPMAETPAGSDDFWKILHQNFPLLEQDGDLQVADSKEIISMFEDLGIELDMDQSSLIPGEWMQFLKSHFAAHASPTESTLKMDSSADTQMTGELKVQANASLPAADLKLDAEVAKVGPMATLSVNGESGEDLPLNRQAFSPLAGQDAAAIVPGRSENLKAVAGESASTAAIPAAHSSDEVKAKSSDIEAQWLAADAKVKDMPADKVMSRQFAAELGQSAAKIVDPLSPMQHAQPGGLALQAPNSLSQSTLPAALQTIQLSPAAASSQWGEAIGERVTFLINQKLNNAEIRIDPPHLGKLDIQIQVKEDSAMVMIQTQNAQTRDLIDSAGHRLREFLQEAGYSSVDVNVSHKEQSLAGEGFDQHSDQAASGQGETSDGAVENELSMQPGEIQITGRGRIDYFA